MHLKPSIKLEYHNSDDHSLNSHHNDNLKSRKHLSEFHCHSAKAITFCEKSNIKKLVGTLVKCGNETLTWGNRDKEEEFRKGEINLH
jgi:hypothetical protein